MTDTRLDWLTLHRACATGAAQALRLLEAAGGDVQLAVHRVGCAQLGAAAVARARAEALLDLQWLDAKGATLLVFDDARYPPLLRGISGAPLLLFVRGDVDTLWLPQLAVVGSRQASAGGLDTARDFAASLASRGFVVTSGLAAGIDAAAHVAALDVGGRSVAVTGTGLDRIYPARHTALARRIAEHGALVTEFPPRTPARRENFPRRNRIISGLALGTLVVEASLGSGSLITARLAAEQGREVYAIPGSIHNPLSKGCHQLIREGAKLTETAQQVVDELAPLLGELHTALVPEPIGTVQALVGADDADYARLRSALGHDPVGMDALVRRTGLTVPVLSSMLLRMQLEGEVEVNPGGSYSRLCGRGR
ncbi:MAG: DNA processing protein DprA [Lysobacterales bacterium]|nr:hypothetical protein [Xanthomonadales bacterium]